MKTIFNKLIVQKKFIFGMIVGIIITVGATYGVNQIQSSSVSYTRDGKTMSVEQAIDDLIVKVNKKGGNFDIKLSERTIGLNYTEKTTDYENIIDSMLEKVISAVGNVVTTEELKVLKDSTLTWTSENENIASISGSTVTGKSIGSTTLLGTGSNGKQVKVPIKVARTEYLADVVQVGDYVAYDAGSWTETKANPTSQGQFGGYTSGQNKANSVSCAQSTTLKGWRVFSIDTNTKTVTLIHAGQPECYYHAFGKDYANASVTNLNNRANTYLNNNYADSAHNMNKGEYDQNILRTTGATYWLATALNTATLLGVYINGGIYNGEDISFGVRPLVVLKPNILTTGKGTDMVGQEAWTLVKP